MKRVYKNEDLTFNINMTNCDGEVIDIRTFDYVNIKVYTNNIDKAIVLSSKDVEDNNLICVASQDLEKLDDGIIRMCFDYGVASVDFPDEIYNQTVDKQLPFYLALKKNSNLNGDTGVIVPTVDLTDYYTKSEIDEKLVNIDLTDYYTKSEIDEKIDDLDAALDAIDFSLYAKVEDIPTVPTNVSAFTNDVPYLTQHQDISGKADKATTYTKTEVDNLINGIDIPETDLTEYATIQYVDDTFEKKINIIDCGEYA